MVSLIIVLVIGYWQIQPVLQSTGIDLFAADNADNIMLMFRSVAGRGALGNEFGVEEDKSWNTFHLRGFAVVTHTVYSVF